MSRRSNRPLANGQLGLSPAAPSACRQFLADHLDGAIESGRAHLAGCSSCRTKVAAAERLGVMLRLRPSVPQELASPAFLEGVYERAIETMEQAPLVAEIGRGIQTPASELAEHPAGLLESSTAEAILSQPPMPSDVTWARVRQSVRAEAQTFLSRHLVLRRLPFAMAIVAASVVITLVVRGTGEHLPTITFSDLASPPSLEMTVLRHGPGH